MQLGGSATLNAVVARLVELFAWCGVAAIGLLMVSQGIGWHGTRLVAATQSLTPYLIVLMVPVAGVAVWTRRDRLAAVAGVVGVAGLLLASPLVFTPRQAAAAADAVGLSVASANLFYENPNVADVAGALADVDADVIVFNEYTAEHQQVLLAQPLADEYPYRLERDGLRAGGVAIWSRYPLTEVERHETINYSLDVLVAGPDGDIRVFGVHPPTPVFNFSGWKGDLVLIGRIASNMSQPTLVVGDFNASYWHPPFRALLRKGFVDAHMAAGQGFATSWPTDRGFPPFVQLDHALTGNGLVSTGIADITLPGSDHRGFVVTVAPARSATP